MASYKDDFNRNKPLSPYSIRFTQEERQQLEHMAHGTSLSEFIRSCLFKENVSIRRTKGRFPVKDEQALSRLLGVLGQSRIPNNINQLAKAANSGSLPVNPDTEKQLYEAYAMSRGTRCSKFLFSVSLNPPEAEYVPTDVFEI